MARGKFDRSGGLTLTEASEPAMTMYAGSMPCTSYAKGVLFAKVAFQSLLRAAVSCELSATQRVRGRVRSCGPHTTSQLGFRVNAKFVFEFKLSYFCRRSVLCSDHRE